MKKLDEVRWGIIGCGDVCEVKSGPALQQVAHSKLVAVMRRDDELAKDFAKRHQVPTWYSDADQLINDPNVNAIYIATPPNTHAEYTIKAANAGKPVYVEKPMAKTHEECIAMVTACKNADVSLFVAFYRRALPNILKVKELLEQGTIGSIRTVEIKIHKTIQPDILGNNAAQNNWRTNPEIAGGGYFYDLGSHQFDALDFLFGPIKKAQGFSLNQSGIYSADDLTVGSFEFENGLAGTGVWAFNTCEVSEMEMTTIIGSKGQISFPLFGDHHVELKVDHKERQVFRFDISPNIQQNLIQSVVEELLGLGKCPSTGESGARTSWVLDQITKKDVNKSTE